MALQVKIERDTYSRHVKYTLLTTANGYQWSGGGLHTIEELKQIRDALTDFLDEHEKSKKE